MKIKKLFARLGHVFLANFYWRTKKGFHGIWKCLLPELWPKMIFTKFGHIFSSLIRWRPKNGRQKTFTLSKLENLNILLRIFPLNVHVSTYISFNALRWLRWKKFAVKVLYYLAATSISENNARRYFIPLRLAMALYCAYRLKYTYCLRGISETRLNFEANY